MNVGRRAALLRCFLAILPRCFILIRKCDCPLQADVPSLTSFSSMVWRLMTWAATVGEA